MSSVSGLYRIWIPLIIVVVAVMSMGALYFAWEAKYSALMDDYKALSGELTAAKNTRDTAIRKMESIQDNLSGSMDRINKLNDQISNLHQRNDEIIKKNNETVKTSEANHKTFEIALAQRDQTIKELNKTIQTLLIQGASTRHVENKNAIHSEFTVSEEDKKIDPGDKIDPRQIEKTHALYKISWERIAEKLKNPDDLQTVAGRQSLVNDYNNCLSQAIKLKRLAQGQEDEDMWNQFQIMHMYMRSRTIPSDIRALSKYRAKTKLQAKVPEKLNDLMTAVIRELNERKKIIDGIPAKRQKKKEYDAKVIRAYP